MEIKHSCGGGREVSFNVNVNFEARVSPTKRLSGPFHFQLLPFLLLLFGAYEWL